MICHFEDLIILLLRKRKKLKARKKGKKRKSHGHYRSDSSPTDSDNDDSEVTESASEKPTSESEGEWVEKTFDDRNFDAQAVVSSRDTSRDRENVRDRKRRRPSRSETVSRTSDGRSEEKEASGSHRQKISPTASRHVEKYSRDHGEITRGRETESRKETDKPCVRKDEGHEPPVTHFDVKHTERRGQDLGRHRNLLEHEKRVESSNRRDVASSSTFAGDDFSRKHFSTDEISFINSLFTRKSDK